MMPAPFEHWNKDNLRTYMVLNKSETVVKAYRSHPVVWLLIASTVEIGYCMFNSMDRDGFFHVKRDLFERACEELSSHFFPQGDPPTQGTLWIPTEQASVDSISTE